MFKPRNSLVVLSLITEAERKVGALTIPTNGDVYTQALVVAVGPGNVSAQGGRSETFDLRVGQIVLVKHKEKHQRGDLAHYVPVTLPYRYEEQDYHMVPETSVLAILQESELPAAFRECECS